jgi:glycosyltransferase involved in cell wall biosynthesis
LGTAVSMTAEQLKAMGLSGKKLIESKYTWARLAQKTINLYQWLLGQCGKPDFVLLS